jgi:hypothetical protein
MTVLGMDNVSSGATSDLQRATNVARSMVMVCLDFLPPIRQARAQRS